MSLTFAEQVKIILHRRGMTIKELAERVEAHTGKKMSRQNMTQKLGRDNFQEQDMRMIAEVLEVPFVLDILDDGEEEVALPFKKMVEEDLTVDAVLDVVENDAKSAETEITEEAVAEVIEEPAEEISEETAEETVEEVIEESTEEPVYETEEEPVQETYGYEAVEEQMAIPEEQPEESLEDLLREMDEIEKESKEHIRERKSRHERKEQGKKHSWRDYFHFPKKEKKEEYFDEDEEQANPDEEVILDYGEDDRTEEAAPVEEAVQEYYDQEPVEEPEEYKQMEEEPVEIETEEGDVVNGDVNPYTGKEYKTNSVRVHPKRIGYVQVYDRKTHQWTDMTEWAFLGYQERQKVLLGRNYVPPIYLD